MGVSNAWADAFWPYAGFYEVYMTYSYNGNNSNYTFRSSDNGATDVTLGTLTTDINVTSLYMKFYKNDNDWGKYGNVCGALMIYNTGSGDQEHQPDWKWPDWDKGTWDNGFQANKYELSSTDTKTLVKIGNSGSGNYTLSLAFKMWGSDDNSSDCDDIWWISNNSQNYKFKYTILPPAVSNIGISATGCIGGTGTQQDPYTVAYGASLNLTASVTNSDANSNTHFTFGSNATSTTKTHTISNITNATAQKITIKAQNINKSDKSLKGTALSKDIYYKYTPVYVYINGQSHQINNTTKQVTVALTQNNGDETYTFKIHDNSSHWLGNNGTMERGGNAVHNGGWTMSADAGDCKLKADLTGDYTFTFMPATNKVTVTYPQKSYFIAGSWDNWAGTAPSFVDASTPVSIYLEADQTYSFKVADLTANATWYGNDGTMTRASSTAWTMSTNQGNCHITTDLAGIYDFTFNQSTKTLTVTYPTKVTLGYCEFGQYGIEYDGTTYYSKPDENVEINIPRGASVRVLEGTPLNNAYTGGVLMVLPTKVPNVENTTITIEGDTKFDDMFVTKASHTVYLNVQNNYWTTAKIYAWNEDGNTTLENLKSININGNTYYEFSIPAGYNNFEFRTTDDTKRTASFPFGIPLNKVNCYTITNSVTQYTGYQVYSGTWDVLPAAENDYRLLYIEQTVDIGSINIDYQHPSDNVKLTTEGETAIVSLHLYNERAEGVNGTNNAAVILQRCTGYDAGVAQWEEVEYHMVYDRLHADASTALLPGRRNTAELQDHDGLEVIKAVADSEEHDFGSGVWNFTIQKTGESATLLLDENNLKPYKGNYYIRTNNTAGGWKNYMQPANHMTFSSYAKANSGYSHYYCKYVDIADNNTIGTHKNVKFIIANDYGTAISKEKADDDYTTNDGTLPANANVRWQWNMVTNEAKRAYIQGSTVQDFLTVTESDETRTKFRDNGNWIYEADITAKVNEKITAITAPYNNQNQSLLEEKYKTEGMPMLTGDGENTSDYTVRVQYDFKINKTIALLIPGEHTIASAIDVLIERTNQGEATQVSVPITAADTENGYTVYAVMSFTKAHIVEGGGTQSEKLYYWVSFPFDVRISDVFGFGEYGVHWIMEYYDGAERAEKGCWADSPTYWRYITDTTSVDIPKNNKNLNCGILKANQGYVLALALNIANMGIFTNTNKVSLYFPSMEPIKDQIDANIIETTVTLDEYKCTIERDNRKIHDSNWHIIGAPSFSDKTQTLTQNNLLYYYTRNQQNDTYNPTSTKDETVTFQSLHSYMVQYAGTINWAATWTLSQPQGLAAKRNVDEEKTHSLRLELSQNGTYNDQTLVTLQEEGATEAFDMNLDLSKMMNAGNNIYTLAGEELIQVAGNALPIANTTIPVGVQIATAGEYTFAMPDGTDGIIVELIDYETNTRTNLLLSDYTVNLPAGTCETRFALSVKIDKTATSVENITEVEGTNGEGVKKYIIDGKLFLQKDNTLYDAQGHIVR